MITKHTERLKLVKDLHQYLFFLTKRNLRSFALTKKRGKWKKQLLWRQWHSSSKSGPAKFLPSRHLSIQPQDSDCVWENLGYIFIDSVHLLAKCVKFLWQKSLRASEGVTLILKLGVLTILIMINMLKPLCLHWILSLGMLKNSPTEINGTHFSAFRQVAYEVS